ncbi:hypothetical protein L3X38_031598 [Prunus dulcis]|uniref:Uncharacterized protein n=1 Tax=Prunus dulcis TaxID=3755 RepID=A0AAD4VDK4_PRUDU|nr:hypothetical protein L3X38_031598 [Prunus dulcis]
MTLFNFKVRAVIESQKLSYFPAPHSKMIQAFEILPTFEYQVVPAITDGNSSSNHHHLPTPKISKVPSLSKPLQYNLKQSLVTKAFDDDEGGGDEASKG